MTTSTPLRSGLIGTGFIAAAHVRALSNIVGAKLQAVFDVDYDRANSFARRNQIPHACRSLEELLQQCDVAHVLVPPAQHVELALACLAGGKHVLLEKPAAVDSAGCKKIADESARTGKMVGINHNLKFDPAFQKLLAAHAERRFGAIQQVLAVVNVPLRQLTAGQHSHWMFQSPLNILLEQAVHPLSQLLVLVGPVLEAHCVVFSPFTLQNGTVFYQDWQVSMQCERGAASMRLSFGREWGVRQIDVIGQDANASVDLVRNTMTLHRKMPQLDQLNHWTDALRNGAGLMGQGTGNLLGYALGFLKLLPPGDAFTVGMAASVSGFYQAVARGQPVPSGIEEGATLVRSCELIYAAALRCIQQA